MRWGRHNEGKGGGREQVADVDMTEERGEAAWARGETKKRGIKRRRLGLRFGYGFEEEERGRERGDGERWCMVVG